jgi:hypothetical protein
MAQEKDQKRPRRGPRRFGLILAGAVATAPSLGCKDSANPTPDAAAAVVAMDSATPMNVVTPDAAAPVDSPTPMDTATAVDTAPAMAMDTAAGMEAMTSGDGGLDARDGDTDVYPPSTRG